MVISPKLYDTLELIEVDDEVSTEGTVRLTIKEMDPNSSATVEIDKDEAMQLIEHLKRVFAET